MAKSKSTATATKASAKKLTTKTKAKSKTTAKSKTAAKSKSATKPKAAKKSTSPQELELLNETGRRKSVIKPTKERRKRRRQIDPTTCEREYSDPEVQFMQAMDEYKRASGRMFPTCSEILEVLDRLGYRQIETPLETMYEPKAAQKSEEDLDDEAEGEDEDIE